jgi:hypothetical protein
MNGNLDQSKQENAGRSIDHIPYVSTCTNHSKKYLFIRKEIEGVLFFIRYKKKLFSQLRR